MENVFKTEGSSHHMLMTYFSAIYNNDFLANFHAFTQFLQTVEAETRNKYRHRLHNKHRVKLHA